MSDRQQAESEKSKIKAQLVQAQKLEAIGTLAGGLDVLTLNLIEMLRKYFLFKILDIPMVKLSILQPAIDSEVCDDYY